MKKWLYFLGTAFMGFILVYISPVSPNYFLYSTFGSLVFWLSLVFLLYYTILKSILLYLKARLNKITVSIFFGYLSIHYVVYSLAVEKLLTTFYGELFTISSPFISFTITPFLSMSIYSAFINVVFNPSITFGFPPNFLFQLSFYAIFMGFIIASLVTATIARVMVMIKTLGGIRAIVIAPLIGVIGGGSCCVSIPIILATAIPAANSLLFFAPTRTALFLAYILLPPVTATALKLHYNTLLPRPPKNVRLNPNSNPQKQ